MRQEKPSWAKTLVPWEIKKVVWQRWSLGDTKRETIKFFEEAGEKYSNAPVHVDTIRRVREELLELPVEQLDKLARELPEIETFIKEKRPDYMQERSGKFIPQSPHSMELSTTAIAIEKNLEKYRKSAACIGSPHCLGNTMFEQNAAANLAGLDEIDRERATDLLFHLKEEFAELKDINDWCDLEDDKITGELIAKLALKGNRGDFTGRCPHCY